MESKIDIANLSFNRTAKLNNDFKKYEINVDLEEENSTDTETTLKYALDLTSNPKNSVISISGFATFTGNQEELENYLQETQNDIPNPVINIYEELFPLMYIITKNMSIPSPAHNIVQNNLGESKPNKINIDDTEYSKSENTSPVDKESQNISELDESENTDSNNVKTPEEETSESQ